MKGSTEVGLWVAGTLVGLTAVFGGLRSCNNYQVNTPTLTATSRATGNVFQTGNKIEYAKLSDGSEELVQCTGRTVSHYQNFDGNNTVDRIRTERTTGRYTFKLESILVRTTDYQAHKAEFDQADQLLLAERARNP